MTDLDFTGQVALVTGAGGGLGKTYALELARRGCKVVVNDLGGARDGTGKGCNMADEVVSEIIAEGGNAVADYHGVHTEAGGSGMIQTALENFGQIDIVIHNAGILRDRSVAKMSNEEWQAVIDVHLSGAFYVCQPALHAMSERGYGRIILTTSTSGMFGNFGQANYGAAKMGQLGLMNTLLLEGAKHGVLVNAISPAALTRMTEDLTGSADPDLSYDPRYVTPAVTYLASRQCQESGLIIHAGSGFFGRVQMAFNQGIFIDGDPISAEQFAENWAAISDMSSLEIQTPQMPYLLYVNQRSKMGS